MTIYSRSFRHLISTAAVFGMLGAMTLAATPPAHAGPIDTIGTGTTSIGYSGSIVDYTVLTTGVYNITAYGALGGGVGTYAGGLNAKVSADFNLTAGSVLDILVGSHGAAGSYNGVGGGGGGGSFVAEANGTAIPTLLAAAGGGGGAFDGFAAGAGSTASYLPNGTSPGGGGAGNVGGSNGGGGSADEVLAGGGGGGGFTGNGQGDFNGSGALGGLSFTAYLAGQTNAYAGGFGGGGEGASLFGPTGGGGGGYSGGGAGGNGYNNDDGAGGGGGGSYLASDANNPVVAAGVPALRADSAGNGFVTFTLLPSPGTLSSTGTSVPEPGPLTLLATGLLGLGWVMRKRYKNR